jgi:hypothetical protein
VGLTEWINISAIILGPILAVQAQRVVESIRERQNGRRAIFHELMATRASRVSPSHVRALNMIDLAFQGQPSVLEVWKGYLDHLNSGSSIPQDDANAAARMQAWFDRGEILLNDLLYEMSRVVRYKFDRVQLRRAIYAPIAITQSEADWELIRKRLAVVLSSEELLRRLGGDSKTDKPEKATKDRKQNPRVD